MTMADELPVLDEPHARIVRAHPHLRAAIGVAAAALTAAALAAITDTRFRYVRAAPPSVTMADDARRARPAAAAR